MATAVISAKIVVPKPRIRGTSRSVTGAAYDGQDGRVQVAAVQFTAARDKVANLERLRVLVAEAAARGAQLVVCPEAAMHPFGRPDESLAVVAEPLDGPFVTGLAACARDCGVTVVAGMFETAGSDRALNTLVVVGPTGLVGRYRKIHLFDAAGWVESDRLARAEIEPLTFPCGDMTVGTLTCYDVRFPELARALVDRGATLLAVPSAWVAGPLKEDQWVTLVRARAIESTCFVVAAGQGPPDYAGRSLVVDPLGVVLAGLGAQDGVALAGVSAQRLADVRRRMPSLEHRRFRVEPAQ
jgi:predicted amidohydrolase